MRAWPERMAGMEREEGGEKYGEESKSK